MAAKRSAAQPLDQLCFSLYASSREIIKRCRPYHDQLGLTYTQYIVMSAIWEKGTISVRDLGRALFLDSGTLTPVLKTLEKNGLITRRRCQTDERVLMVSLAPAGMALEEAARLLEQPVQELGLTAQETATLLRLLDKILAACGKE